MQAGIALSVVATASSKVAVVSRSPETLRVRTFEAERRSELVVGVFDMTVRAETTHSGIPALGHARARRVNFGGGGQVRPKRRPRCAGPESSR